MQDQYQLDHSLDQYVAKLCSYGIEPNPKLKPAFFYLKNGLRYPGLLTTQEVSGQEDLVKIPIHLLLTAHKAMKDPELAPVFSNKFYKEGTMWQDRILVTYLLFLLSKDKDCIWTHMARQFSKQIDIISFWQDHQFNSFVDKSVIKAAKKERNHFEKEWISFQSIQKEYPILNDPKWFTKEHYKWIYIHTISRCFGSFLKSTYFVPFCQLFNHNCVDVSYVCINENKQPKQVCQQKVEEEDNRSEDSVSSGYSEDYLSDDDFDYMSITSYTIKWCSKVSYDLKEKETKIIDKQLKDTFNWIQRELELRGFTLLYLGQIIQKLKIFENQYKAGRQKFTQTQEKIENLKLSLFAYRKYLVELYRSQGRQYQKIKNERGEAPSLRGNNTWSHFQKTKEQCQQVYTHFKMQARDQAFFKKNSQIYFSYGKLSNRTLLVRYGFSLQDNPYDHVWLKFKLGKHIEAYPDLFELIQEKGLSVNYKVKLKNYTFAIEPIIYYRVLGWKQTHHCLEDIFFITDLERQINILKQVKEIYESELIKYDLIDEKLQDKDLGYHQYFTKVYNIQKKKILRKQIEAIAYLLLVFGQILSKEIEVKGFLVKEEYTKFLKHYLKAMRGLTKI